MCFAFATDIRLLLAASKAADVHENSRVCSKSNQITLLSDIGTTKTAGIFISDKAHAHMPPPDLRDRKQQMKLLFIKNGTVYSK